MKHLIVATSPDRPGALPPDLADALALVRPSVRAGGSGPRVHYYPLATSTNDLALRLAHEGAPDGTVIVAGQQSAGRGRGGHAWFSPPGSGLYVTVLLRPGTGPADWPQWLTLAAGVALADGIRSASGLPVSIKWPNDLVVAAPTGVRDARKLGGVLAEAQTSGGRLDAVVVGYGVNVGLATYPADIRARATSLEAELGRPVDRALVLGGTLGRLVEWIDRLRTQGGASIVRRWRELGVGVTGARVEWQEGDAVRVGITAGLDADGALLVRQGGVTGRIRAGEVRWL